MPIAWRRDHPPLAGQSRQRGHKYTCEKVIYQEGSGPEVHIPALDGWSNLFKRTEDGGFNRGAGVWASPTRSSRVGKHNCPLRKKLQNRGVEDPSKSAKAPSPNLNTPSCTESWKFRNKSS